jgi:ABC-type sugar transport system permease subunit
VTHLGLTNYAKAFGDPVFWLTIQHTAISFVVTFTLSTLLGFVFAALLHSRPWFGGLYKVALFVPVVLAPAIMAPVFRQIFANDGQFNWLLEHIGLGALAQPWLAQSGTALAVILAITIWGGTGVSFILYSAAMGQIDPEQLEAAELDGAGNIRRLVSIIWPNVRGTTLALATLSAIGALKTFDIPYLVTVGGPNFATEFLGTLIYRTSIPLGQVGYGAALSILLLVIALVMAIVLNAGRNKRGARTDA